MLHNLYRAVQQHRMTLMKLTALIIALSILLNSTPLLLAQSSPDSAAQRLFLPLVRQTSNSTEAIDAAATTGQKCYIGANNPTQVSAQQSWTVDPVARTVKIRTTLAKTFVDNTYGTGAVGWPNGHKFGDLTGSDQVQVAFYDASGVNKIEFKTDYFSASSAAPSGYKTLGVSGGDGKMVSGNAAYVLSALTSMDVNFNQFGYVLTTNSPTTDANYTPNAQYPNWIYEVWYEVTINLDAFGAAGFGYPIMTGVHASPSKTGNNTEPVVETPCPTPPTPTPTPGGPTPTPTATAAVTTGQKCYIGTNNPTQVGAQQTWTVDPVARTVKIRTTLAKTFVDNTYGTGAVGWPKGHKFGDLTGSDQVQVALYDASGVNKLEFKTDYFSASSSAPSGYDTLGISGGDGKLISGNASYFLGAVTSMDVNFNQFGYVLTTNSPTTDANYMPNPQYPNWIYDVWYEDTVSLDAFGAAGFGSPSITGVHASPSKTGNNTEPVNETPCPAPPTPTPIPTNTPSPLASLGDRVWNDTNRNGIQDAGETGVPNVIVALLSGCTGNTLVNTTFTDANGNYGFANLAAGQYRVQVSPPSGFVFSLQNQGANDAVDSDVNTTNGISDCITLVAGQNDPNWDAGINQPPTNTAALGDRVWNDSNRNGIQDSGEVGVPNVTVTLLSSCSGNTVVGTTTTDANGNYGFSNLAAGQYLVQMSLPSGFVFSPQNQGANDAVDSDVNTANGISDCITLVAGQNDLNWDAGINQPVGPTPTNTPVPPTPTNTPVPASACLGDRTWVDSNGNGVQDAGEANLPGVTIKLWTDNDGNGTPDTQVNSTVSDANGAYQFCNLTPGVRYIVQFITPNGYNLTIQASPFGSDATNSDPSPNNGGYTDVIVLAANQNNPNIDAGFVSNAPTPTPTNTPVPNTASLGDRVWNDTNRNGIQDSGEAGVPNVTVTLLSSCSGNTVVGTTTTDANGNYGFSNLAAGQYRVRMSLPSGYQFSPQNQGANDAVDSDVNTANGISDCITLAAGQNDPNWDAGINQPPAGNTVSIGDKVWLDLNQNGVQDAGEPGIANVNISLYCANTGGTLVATTTTDANGNYLFSGLDPACTYVIQVIPPYGRGFTVQYAGSDRTKDSNVDPNNGYSGGIDVPPGQSDLTIDIGMIIVEDPVIGDRVWNDSNANGIQDAGEVGVPYVTVKLYDGAGQLLRTTVTDIDGFYLFDNLPNGSYQAQFVLSAGYVFSPPDQGSNDALDSDANPATGYTAVVTLNGTVVDLTWDAGIHK